MHFQGAGSRKGDSGGGLVFRNPTNNLWYLRGIVSTTDREKESSISTFTDVAYYTDWINGVRKKIDGM